MLSQKTFYLQRPKILIYYSNMKYSNLSKKLIKNAQKIASPGRGILAADESTPTMTKRLATINVKSTEENRRLYRQMLFMTRGVGKFISGVILFDETIRQKADDGTPFPKVLKRAGIVPGIKVDKGAKPLALTPDELVTEGLDGLRDRLIEYYKLGARFTKWRAVIQVHGDAYTRACIGANAHALARFAALSQEQGLVPIVEPEVLMDGAHTMDECEMVTRAALEEVFSELFQQGVLLEGMLLKPNMIVPGSESRQKATPRTVAEATVRCFLRAVPAAVPGIMFLSGGLSDTDATAYLNQMNKMGPHPWELSFSFGRALQAPVLKAWGGKSKNTKKAQEAYYKRAKLNSAARYGKYRSSME